MSKVNKYSLEANSKNLTTEAPDVRFSSSTSDYGNSTIPRYDPSLTTSAPKIFESGEDPTLDSTSTNEDEDGDDDELDEEEDDFDDLESDIEDDQDIDMEEKTNTDNIGLAVTNFGEGTNMLLNYFFLDW